MNLSHYDISMEQIGGERVLRARTVHPETGFRVALTFPAEPAGADLERFKARIVRSLLERGP